ncbi:MAG: 2-amino-4-hydroxy-6-hydroxymethyldihydropteridine diphosphokinase [Anaerolineaceae bacterium]|nr:2-amino-4-hydroxy-6-hydroxymethyldihydropteridine diphosphokinase [Anaerolineaceae bacterium]
MQKESLVWIGLGTNLGNRIGNLEKAREMLSCFSELMKMSSIYETDPWGYEAQNAFLNQVIEIKTSLSPLNLLKKLKKIEGELGREPTFRYGPRLIDLDILFYEDALIDEVGLEIPHPKISERAFVLVPLAEISPDFHHPVLNCKVREMLEFIELSSVRLYQTGE